MIFQFFFKASFTNGGDRGWYNVSVPKTGRLLKKKKKKEKPKSLKF